MMKEFIQLLTSDNTVIAMTYVSFLATLFFSMRKPHKRISYHIFKNKKVYVLFFWNSGDGVIFREDIHYLYIQVNKAYKIISIDLFDDEIPLEIIEHKDNYQSDENTIRLDLSFDYILPRTGFVITINNEQTQSLVPVCLDLKGRIRGESVKSLVYETGDSILLGNKQENEIVQCITLFVTMILISLSAFSILYLILQPFEMIFNRSKGLNMFHSLIAIAVNILFIIYMSQLIRRRSPERALDKKFEQRNRQYKTKSIDYIENNVDLVETKEELQFNINSFDKYLSNKDSDNYLFALSKLRNSKHIVVVNSPIGYKFYPGEFIGIAYNTIEKYKKINIYRKDIYSALSEVIDNKPEYNELMETEFRYYCQLHGGILNNYLIESKRKYWVL